jgi:hypothetical protein
MTTTSTPTTGPPSAARRPRPTAPAPSVLPPSGRQRRWTLALFAILLTVGAGLLFALLYINAGDRVPVVAMARDVARGQALARDDLTEVRVAADPSVDLVPASDIDDLVGQTASVDLAEGSLLTEGQIGETIGLPPGATETGVTVDASDVPFTDLRPGMTVAVVFTPEPPDKSELPEGQRIITIATVSRVETTIDAGVLLVTLQVDEDDVVDVETADHLNLLSLVRVNPDTPVPAPPSDAGTDSGEDSTERTTTTS